MANADTPSWSPVSIIEKNSTQWNGHGISILPDWVAEDLRGLANVNITVSGTPTTTEIILAVGAPTGRLDDTGALETIAVTGIVTADFVVLKASDGSTQTVTFTDNGDGTYTGVGTGLATGTADLVAPSAMASTGLLIESTGAATVTI